MGITMTKETTLPQLHKYYFQGTRWIPSYGDTDWDDIEIEAVDRNSAWDILREKWRFTAGVELVSIDGKRVMNK